jgi:hypothetical protein
MSENPPAKTDRSALQVFLGLLLGILISIGCNLLSILVGMFLKVQSNWLFCLLIAVSLVAAGAIVLRTMGKSSFAVGVLISLSVSLLLVGTCAIAYR